MPVFPGDLPIEFLSRMKGDLGAEYEVFIQSLSQEPPVSVFWNPLKYNNSLDVLDKFKWHPNAGLLANRPNYTTDPAFHAGAYYPQEAGSSFLFELLKQTIDPNKTPTCIDLCAAPGGKSLQILSYLNGKGFLFANEIVPKRNFILQEVLTKWGHTNYIITQNHTRHFEHYNDYFDLVLVDAPCSGEGLFRKTPKTIKEWSPEAVKLCANRQKEILKEAMTLVQPEGFLIYSTCTFSKSENEEVVQEILKNNQFEVADIKPNEKWPAIQFNPTEPGKGLRFYPHKTKSEGLFYAVFKKLGNRNTEKTKVNNHSKPNTSERLFLSEFIEFDIEDIWIEDGKIHLESGDKRITPNKKSGLNFNLAGSFIGTLKQGSFIPSQQLSMRTDVKFKRRIDVSTEQALQYLRKGIMEQQDAIEGWSLISNKGLGLGWLKKIGKRGNNYYPKNWRIRNY